ncbi:universal stress protein [Kitasatospora sp. RG8]|nr:universal stress protein [Kitasatospora sp. RG8]
MARSQGRRLVVVARHGEHRGPLGRLGSTCQAVVRHARGPVALVPG